MPGACLRKRAVSISNANPFGLLGLANGPLHSPPLDISCLGDGCYRWASFHFRLPLPGSLPVQTKLKALASSNAIKAKVYATLSQCIEELREQV